MTGDIAPGVPAEIEPIAVAPIYYTSVPEREFRQGEVLTGVRQYRFDHATEEVHETVHDFSVLFSQDCDLLQDFNKASKKEQGELNGVLLFEAHPTPIARVKAPGSDVWRKIVSNREERYHSLQSAPAAVDLLGQGLPDLVIDFKRVFTIPVADLAYQCRNGGEAARRCCLQVPYREHLQARYAAYLQRIALPAPHEIASLKG